MLHQQSVVQSMFENMTIAEAYRVEIAKLIRERTFDCGSTERANEINEAITRYARLIVEKLAIAGELSRSLIR